MDNKEQVEKRIEMGKKVTKEIQDKFKENLGRFIKEHQELLPKIKKASAQLDQDLKKQGPYRTLEFYKKLGSDYTEFEKIFMDRL
ncbi:MAG: hypothetical protein ACTSXK_02485 [Promethearchaeota archaeon]